MDPVTEPELHNWMKKTKQVHSKFVEYSSNPKAPAANVDVKETEKGLGFYLQ